MQTFGFGLQFKPDNSLYLPYHIIDVEKDFDDLLLAVEDSAELSVSVMLQAIEWIVGALPFIPTPTRSMIQVT